MMRVKISLVIKKSINCCSYEIKANYKHLVNVKSQMFVFRLSGVEIFVHTFFKSLNNCLSVQTNFIYTFQLFKNTS